MGSENAHKLLDLARLGISAVGCWISFNIWLFFRRASYPLGKELRRMFAAIAIVLCSATVANLGRIGYGPKLFEGVLGRSLEGILYAAMVFTAWRFYWALRK